MKRMTQSVTFEYDPKTRKGRARSVFTVGGMCPRCGCKNVICIPDVRTAITCEQCRNVREERTMNAPPEGTLGIACEQEVKKLSRKPVITDLLKGEEIIYDFCT